MKNYDLHIEVRVTTTENYNAVSPLKFSITEVLPVNIDPHKYIRQRLSEELSRNFKQLKTPIDNFEESAQEEVDPLGEETIPF